VRLSTTSCVVRPGSTTRANAGCFARRTSSWSRPTTRRSAG
jgi:hypothetical protein